jgi:hypothetical protein
MTMTVDSGVLSFGYTPSVVPTVTSVNVASYTGSTAVLDTTPTFTGTADTVSVDYTPTGSISAPTFTGTTKTVTATHPTVVSASATFKGDTKTLVSK